MSQLNLVECKACEENLIFYSSNREEWACYHCGCDNNSDKNDGGDGDK